MRNQFLKTAAATVMGLGVLVGAKTASANTHGVVFIHGTGDYPVAGQTSPSVTALTCSGAAGSTNCYSPAAYGGSNYWEAGEVASVANGRPWAVVGYYGGACAPWPQSGDGTYGKTSTAGGCPLPTGTGNGDIIAAQIQQFITANSLTELVIVTHSGGSNQARYLLDNYTRNSYYTNIKNITKRVVTLAGTTDGTYLANEVFGGSLSSTVIGVLAGWVGYGGEGVNLLRTNYMNTYNSSSSYLGGKVNPVSGVNFYASGGVSGSTCVGVTLFGTCIGVKAQTLGGIIGACDSSVDDAALLALHDLYLDSNDSSTYRNSCSDGFISCQGSQALGNTFAYNEGQDHNQSRRQCNNLDVNTRNVVAGAASGFSYGMSSGETNPHQLDACGFGEWAAVTSGSRTIAYTEGCTTSQLGNGNCDWDCVALYGNDAVVTQWDSTGKKPLAWGASDCTATTESYNGTTYIQSSTDPWAENLTYTTASGTFNTTFSGYTCTGTSAQCGGNTPSTSLWFTDPNAGNLTSVTATATSNTPSADTCPASTVSGTTEYYSPTTNTCVTCPSTYGYNPANNTCTMSLSVGFCPQSWVGDGTCDECVLALYGSDGMDCAPGHIVQCGGIVTGLEPYSGSSYYNHNNPIYNEGTPSSGGSTWLEWQSMSAVSGDGVCENTECGLGTAAGAGMTSTGGVTTYPTAAGTPCTNSNQCPGNIACNTTTGYCYACNTSGLTCNSSQYGWSGGTCNPGNGNCYATTSLASAQCASNADCLTGTCALTEGTCTTDANCPGPSPATSTCTSGVCTCTTSTDCSSGATCNNPSGNNAAGSCATSVTQSLCR